MLFTEEKLAKQLNDLRSTIHKQIQDIPSFKYIEGDFEEIQLLKDDPKRPAFDDSAWRDFKVGSHWGGYDKGAWFRAKLTVPPSWIKEKLALRFLVGPRDGGGSTAETLLYVDGHAIQGIDVWHDEAWLPPEYAEKGEITIALKAWSSVLKVPDRRCFKLAQLIVVDEPAERFYYLADNLLKAVKELQDTDIRRTRILQLVDKAFLKIDFIRFRSDFYYDSVKAACEELEEGLTRLQAANEMKPKVIGIGHSHIDMAWLWRLAHSREKASRTFSTVLHLMRQYPEYRFLHTSPQLYKYLKQDYPEIYAEVKKRIASGEWEITGGMWIEPDTNVPNGESLIRQILFGKRFMKQEFGQETNVVFLPDVFGYNWALPQIIRRSGIDNFITSKISWNQYNRFPHDTFMWRGVDGTEILTHFITTPEVGSRAYTYNGIIDPYEVKGTWDQYKQKEVNDELLMAFGWGDGGGGPTKEMLEAGRVLKNLPGFPSFEMGKMEPYLERLNEKVKPSDLPVWDGELYLEYHRGTYTSQGFIKKANRQAEILYHTAEWLGVLANSWTDDFSYVREQLNEGWEQILLNQFHDILPGSSIRQVYEDAREDYKEILEIGEAFAEEAKSSLVKQIKTEQRSIIVFNSLSWERDGIIEMPWSPQLEGMMLEGSSSVQVIEEAGSKKMLLKATGVPSLGYRAFHVVPLSKSTVESVEKPLYITTDKLENRYYRITLNRHGQIVSLYDKQNKREVLAAGERGNVLQVFEDRPLNFDAWDIDIYYANKMQEITELVEAEVEEHGPIRGALRLKWKFNQSVITQRLTLYADCPRIDFRTEVDWQERQTLLKAAFPVQVRSSKATYDIQFGNIERPTHWNTSWDYARFEVCAQKWADLSEGNFGVALLNDCKYGYDIKDHMMRLTLIKSPIEPDETADRGKHEFTYSLLPHAGGWREGNVVREAYELNYPLLASKAEAQPSGTLPSRIAFAELDCDNAIIETIKKAEDEDACIVRVYEFKQYRSNEIKLTFDRPVRKAISCNLVEDDEGPVPFKGNQLEFSLQPYEIKTFKVWF